MRLGHQKPAAEGACNLLVDKEILQFYRSAQADRLESVPWAPMPHEDLGSHLISIEELAAGPGFERGRGLSGGNPPAQPDSLEHCLPGLAGEPHGEGAGLELGRPGRFQMHDPETAAGDLSESRVSRFVRADVPAPDPRLLERACVGSCSSWTYPNAHGPVRRQTQLLDELIIRLDAQAEQL